jgi:hypothetical protein
MQLLGRYGRAGVIAIAIVGCGGAGDDPGDDDPVLAIELPGLTSGYSGTPVGVDVRELDGTRVETGPVDVRMEVPIHPGAVLSIGEDTSSSPTSTGSSSTIYTALEPGDTVRHRRAVDEQVPTPERFYMNITPPALPADPELFIDFGAYGRCGSGSGHQLGTDPPLIVATFDLHCVVGSSVDVVIYVVDPDGQILAFSTTLPLEREVTAVGTYAPLAEAAITLTGLPPDATSVSVTRSYDYLETFTAETTAVGGEAQVELPYFPPSGRDDQLSVTVTRESAIGYQTFTFGESGDAPLATLDLAPHELPWFTSAPSGSTLAWTTTGGGAPDVVLASTAYSSGITPPVSSRSATVFGPGNVSSFAFTATDPLVSLVLVDDPGWATYHDVLRTPMRGGTPVPAGMVRVTSQAIVPPIASP